MNNLRCAYIKNDQQLITFAKEKLRNVIKKRLGRIKKADKKENKAKSEGKEKGVNEIENCYNKDKMIKQQLVNLKNESSPINTKNTSGKGK